MKIIKSRMFRTLLILFMFGFILGIITFIIIDNKSLNEDIKNYFNLIGNGNFNYIKSLLNSIISNNKYLFFIWISGIILTSIIFIPFIIIYRGISLGLVISSIIFTFKLKGILYSFLLIIPCVFINNLIYIICSYYSLKFSMKIYNSIKYDKLIKIKSFSKNYLYIFIIFSFILLLSSLFETYISSNIIKFVL